MTAEVAVISLVTSFQRREKYRKKKWDILALTVL
jgi:hypothetical protein